jgi:hypothetical protein
MKYDTLHISLKSQAFRNAFFGMQTKHCVVNNFPSSVTNECKFSQNCGSTAI